MEPKETVLMSEEEKEEYINSLSQLEILSNIQMKEQTKQERLKSTKNRKYRGGFHN